MSGCEYKSFSGRARAWLIAVQKPDALLRMRIAAEDVPNAGVSQQRIFGYVAELKKEAHRLLTVCAFRLVAPLDEQRIAT
jgi:hypothetical protein